MRAWASEWPAGVAGEARRWCHGGVVPCPCAVPGGAHVAVAARLTSSQVPSWRVSQGVWWGCRGGCQEAGEVRHQAPSLDEVKQVGVAVLVGPGTAVVSTKVSTSQGVGRAGVVLADDGEV